MPSYADHTQLYLAFSPNVQGDDASVVKVMRACIMDLRKWMIRDRLMLKDDKTEFLLLGTKQKLAKVGINYITLSGIKVPGLILKLVCLLILASSVAQLSFIFITSVVFGSS